MPLESERKFDVDERTPLPDLRPVAGVATIDPPDEVVLRATYFDTPDLALFRAAVTLRRRTGGEDEGWHLKRPATGPGHSGESRNELRVPLDGGDAVPPELVREIRELITDRPLRPAADITTRRRVHRLRDPAGRVLCEVDDDRVTARSERTGAVSWREWEVELHDSEPSLLDLVGRRLESAGARTSDSPSKLARALRDGTGGPGTRRVARRGGRRLTEYLRAQVDVLRSLDPAVRSDEPDAVHRARVATRRLRSVLATFRPLLKTSVTEPLRDELAWLGTLLGEARDSEVLRDRFARLAAEQPPETLVGTAYPRIAAVLEEAHHRARQRLQEGMDDSRYDRLRRSLDGLVAIAPLTRGGRHARRGQLGDGVRHEARRVDRAVLRAALARTEESRDRELHEVRKAAKRLRYAAEAAGKPWRHWAERAAKVQEELGEFHDAVVARSRVREIAAAAYLEGENTFAFGWLSAREDEAAREARRRAERAITRLRRAR